MANLIYQFPTPIPMTNGNYPQFKFAVFGDTLATVTTAGYLNSSAIESTVPLSNADVIMCLYGFNQQTESGSFAILTVSIASTNGQITLTAWGDPGDVVLPTTANYLAHFTNSNGTLSSSASNVTNAGNIYAGLSGTAGTLSSFPSTGSKGSLILAAVANTGNTTTTISNASMGQASVISIPDPGAATADFAVAPSALVNGNLIEASGTAGLIADSGVSVASINTALKTQTAIVTMTAAQVIAAYGTPFLIVAAPASGFALMPIACQIITVVSTAFTSGGIAQLQWGNTVHAGGVVALDATTPTAEITAAASQIYTQYGVPTTTATAIASANGLGLYFTNATQAFATGTGSTVTIAVTYMTVPV